MGDELLELKTRLSKLSDEQLIEMVTSEAGDYRKEALDYARTELKYRHVDLTQLTAAPEEPVTPSSPEPSEAPIERPDTACFVCGGELRPGTLVAEKELTIVFDDTHEERFVRVNACIRCGQISLIVDNDTEVRP